MQPLAPTNVVANVVARARFSNPSFLPSPANFYCLFYCSPLPPFLFFFFLRSLFLFLFVYPLCRIFPIVEYRHRAEFKQLVRAYRPKKMYERRFFICNLETILI